MRSPPWGGGLAAAAGFAEAAYLPHGDFAGDAGAARFTAGLSAGALSRLRFFNAGGSQAYLAVFDDVAVLGFRGTEAADPRDWLADVKFRMARDQLTGGRVHRGFLGALDRIWPPILEALLAPSRRSRRLVIVGHSLGAGLAIIAAARLALITDLPLELITFGAPRAGGAGLVAALSGVRWVRVVNGADVVTRLPPWIFGYRHGGDLRYMPRAGPVMRGASWMTIFADRLRRADFRPSRAAANALGDHRIGVYRDRLERAELIYRGEV